MSVWIVRGGKALSGRVRVQGSKNAVLPIMAASLLTGGETILQNCPDLLDVEASIHILRHLGCAVRREKDTICINSAGVSSSHIPHELMLKMRSSVMYMGAILARTGEARLSTPGGCELGSRPIDLHTRALRELGAEITEEGGEVYCRVKKLRGCHINLDFPSVGATENAMIAACAAEGETVITNAAREPEIVDLQNFLRAAGARISGAGTPVIVISSFDPEPVTRYTVMSDRIAASTFLCAAAAAGGEVEVEGVDPEHVATVAECLREMGCGVLMSRDGVHLRAIQRLRACRPVITKPYPGFPTDAQALMMAASLKADGTTVFVENIFESRYRHTGELCRLGADIRTVGRVAMVTGVPILRGAPVSATDLRGGASLVIAALAASGETRIYDAGHIERGYEGLDTVLRGLGADIVKEEA